MRLYMTRDFSYAYARCLFRMCDMTLSYLRDTTHPYSPINTNIYIYAYIYIYINIYKYTNTFIYTRTRTQLIHIHGLMWIKIITTGRISDSLLVPITDCLREWDK